MEIGAILKGTAAGITAGTVCYAVSKASSNKKRTLKKRTAKAVKAVSGVISSISSFME